MRVILNYWKTMKNIEDSSAFSDEMLARRIEYLSGFMLPERYRTLCKTVEQRTRYDHLYREYVPSAERQCFGP